MVQMVFTHEALQRSQRTMQAAAILNSQAYPIAQACIQASNGEIIVSVVEQTLVFGGLWVMPLTNLHAQLKHWDDSRWLLTFPP